jgi:ribosomal protein S18 acetylase RimI-like enzyme
VQWRRAAALADVRAAVRDTGRMSMNTAGAPTDPGSSRPPGTPGVRLARPEDIPGLAVVLARAFATDPFFRFIAADGPDRVERMRDAWGAMLRHGSAGLVQTYTTGDLAGAAVWLPPGHTRPSLLDSIRMMPAMARLSRWSRLAAVGRAMTELDLRHRHHAPGPHHYLMALGVDPDRQGQGIGSALMAPVLERCDREGRIAYLETSTPGGRRLYERHGFEVVEERTLRDTTTRGWLMLRRPRGTAAPVAARRTS